MPVWCKARYTVAGCLAAVLLIAVPILAQGAATWTSIGPEGGEVPKLAIDPGNSSIVYVLTTPGGLFKSVDGGASWQSAVSGLAGESVTAVAIDSQTPPTLYAGTYGSGVFTTASE